MAKAIKQRKNDGKSVKITTPSRFGSHSSMIVGEHTLDIGADQVVLKDEFGHYITFRNRLDNGLSDPLRWAEGRVKLEIETPQNEYGDL